MNAWKDLPNASHIDWVLESLKTHRSLWQDTYNQEWNQTYYQALEEAWRQAREEVREEAWYQAREQAFSQAREQAFSQARGQAWDQARDQVSGVLLALIAYDDAVKYLSMTSNELEVWAKISEDPCAVLLLPMVQVKEKLKEMELV